MLLLAHADQMETVVAAWHAVGVEDVTLFQSKSLIQVHDRCRRDDLPLLPSLLDIFADDEFDHNTIFTVVDGEAPVERLLTAAEQQIGDLDDPGNGVLIVLPVAPLKGLRQPVRS